MDAKDRILFPLDVPNLDAADHFVRDLAGEVGGFKVGLELLTAEGSPNVVEFVHDRGGKIFYDGKFKDIPATVAAAAAAAASLEVDMFNLHADGGVEMMQAAIEHRGEAAVLAVTVLTSLGEEEVQRIYRRPVAEVVLEFALMAKEAGVQGLICSPQELLMLKSHKQLDGLLYVTPGVRPAWAGVDDQKRTMTPGEAVKVGADYLVIGRPIRKPPAEIGSPREAVRRIVAEIEEVLSS